MTPKTIPVLVGVGRQACWCAEAAIRRLNSALAEYSVSWYGILDGRICDLAGLAHHTWCLSSESSSAGSPQHLPFSSFSRSFASQLKKLCSELRQIAFAWQPSSHQKEEKAVHRRILVLSLDESFSLNVGRSLLLERDLWIGAEVVLLRCRWHHEVPHQAVYTFLQEMATFGNEFSEVTIMDARPIEGGNDGDCIQRRDCIGDTLAACLLDSQLRQGGVGWPLDVASLSAPPFAEVE